MSDDNRNVRLNEPLLTHNMAGGNGNAKLPWVVLAVVILVVLISVVLFREKLFSGDSASVTKTDATTEQKPSGYQAVFLSNGQVYFGKLTDISAIYANLEDIYYLQVTQPPIQGSQQPGQQQQQAQQQLSLVKLGNELHGPVDEMKINRDQILFFEDMKEDGRVMQAIREYQKNPPANSQAPDATPTPNAPSVNTNTGR